MKDERLLDQNFINEMIEVLLFKCTTTQYTKFLYCFIVIKSSKGRKIEYLKDKHIK